ncbi:HPF/RaiA family ribosome-associated protein [uncultured Paludibaculum sp.]|uniref:HPF/RaiA family ribosome-associated protein n=1 Tax=uncultured Paludibaculum sp. TaxID=1765020 RepID=UPI002AAAF64B|nr:HPF/RaiA family ribosome-associated protein [uncultured Paludibaculum sp.]
MNLSIRTHGIEVTGELQQYVERRIGFALDRYESRLAQVVVYLDDTNGPKGGLDKLCQITAELPGLDRVKILEQNATFAGAVDGAARRLGYRIQQALRRRRPEDAAHRLHRRAARLERVGGAV